MKLLKYSALVTVLATLGIPAVAYATQPADSNQTSNGPFPVTVEETDRIVVEFNDTHNNLFADDIHWAKQKGYTNGYSDGTFRPLEPVSREAFAAFLYRALGNLEEVPTNLNCFSDISNSAFKKEICWLKEQGITKGWSDGTFRPKESIERGAVAAFFARVTKIDLPDYYLLYAERGFSPDAMSSPFYKEILWFTANGLANGWDDGTFRANLPLNRDAAMAFLHRYMTTSQHQLKLPIPNPLGGNAPGKDYLEMPW